MLAAFLVWLAIFKWKHIVSLGSILAAPVVPLVMLVEGEPLEYVAFGALAAVIVIGKHKDNIGRLLRGEEKLLPGKRGNTFENCNDWSRRMGYCMMIELAGRNNDLIMYCRNPARAEEIRKTRENGEYLPGAHIPEKIRITSDLEEAVEGAGCVIICTPSHVVEDMAARLKPWLMKDAVVVCASKGLADNEGHRLSEGITKEVAGITDKIVALSGPNHAEEVGIGLPCARWLPRLYRKRCRLCRTCI